VPPRDQITIAIASIATPRTSMALARFISGSMRLRKAGSAGTGLKRLRLRAAESDLPQVHLPVTGVSEIEPLTGLIAESPHRASLDGHNESDRS
jgi:hypothetical protein